MISFYKVLVEVRYQASWKVHVSRSRVCKWIGLGRRVGRRTRRAFGMEIRG